MRRSQAFIKTLKEIPTDADSINAVYLIRGDFIRQNMAGVYAFLPLGFKVLKKIEEIIRTEMNKIGGQEMEMNVLQSRELWDETNRWQEGREIMYQFKDSRGKEIGLGWTHEEQLTDIIRNHTLSYKDLPQYLYQIQTKFRNEPRPRSGLLRGREFLMKDMYSFHVDKKDFDNYYEKVKIAYLKVFDRCGLKAKIVEASGGEFSQFSHEFQVLCETGEDEIFYCDKCDWAQNKEIAKVAEGDKCPKCGGQIEKDKSIEVGNIFPLKNKFSSAMKAQFTDHNGVEKDIIMGCYGIGLTRLMGTAVEMFHDNYGIIWPEAIAPYKVNLISLDKNSDAEKIYHDLEKAGIEVLYDDRDGISAGEKFADADLLGCPYRIIVSEKSLTAGGAEISKRQNPKKFEIVPIDKILDKVR